MSDAGDLRRAFLPYCLPQYQVLVPGDLRRDLLLPYECGHGRSIWCDCPECEVIRARDRALAWGVTAGALAVVAWGSVLVVLLRWLGG